MFITFVLIRTNKRNRFGHSDSSVLEESRYFNWSYQDFIYRNQIFQIFSHKCVLFSLEMHYRPFSKLQLIFSLKLSLHFQILVQLLLLLASQTCDAQMPALFAGRFFYKGQHVYTDPDEAYRLRARYAEKHGPFGDDFLANVS